MVILKYYEWLLVEQDYREVIYELCQDNTFKRIRQVSKDEAIRLIKENNLTRVHRDNNGAIWR